MAQRLRRFQIHMHMHHSLTILTGALQVVPALGVHGCGHIDHSDPIRCAHSVRFIHRVDAFIHTAENNSHNRISHASGFPREAVIDSATGTSTSWSYIPIATSPARAGAGGGVR